jgi:energy-coupling factor transporter ATP-binding protein EcfA2
MDQIYICSWIFKLYGTNVLLIVAHVNTGAGGSGKSTVFKQMKVIYGDQYSELERRQHLPIIYGYAKKSEYHFDLCTHMLNDEHRINMTIFPPCSWHCTALHCTALHHSNVLNSMKILADQAVKMDLDGQVECKEQFNMVRGSFLGAIFFTPFNSIPCPHALPLLCEHSVCHLTPSHNIHPFFMQTSGAL